jgi:transcriptional regulator with XRE-family HTH domain
VGQPLILKSIGEELRKARESKKMSLDQVVAKLALLGINCSKSNLSRIELNQTTCRTDIFAALAFIYRIKPELLLYKTKITF